MPPASAPERTPAPAPVPEPHGAFHRVRDRLGADIVDGTLAAGSVITIEELEHRTGTSRSIVREATRVLVSLGMLRATQRVGLRVLPDDSWNVFDPNVIRWRLSSPGRLQQLRELFELRLAVEPEAARRAAERRDDAQAAALLATAHVLAGADAHPQVFLRADLQFHRLVVQASGNNTFVHLGDVIGEALRERATVERADRAPDAHDLRLHVEVARSIDRRDGVSAGAGMREIIERTHGG